jgi:hypothetical protein
MTLSGRIVDDELDAVLRPIAAARAERDRAAAPEPQSQPESQSQPEAAPQQDPVETARPAAKRRTAVPSWDEILLGSGGRPSPEDR